MSGALFSFDNAMYGDKIHSIEALPGTTVIGDLNNLRSRQLSRGVYLKTTNPDDVDPPGIRIKFVPVITQTGQLSQSYYSAFGVRVIGILGLPLFEYRTNADSPPAPREIRAYGNVYTGAAITSTVDFGDTPWYRWRGSEGADPTIIGEGAPSPVHRFIIVDEADVLNYGSIDIRAGWIDQSRGRPSDGMYIGGVWIGNAITIPNGFDPAWSTSMTDRRDLSASRSGQVYAREVLPLRTLQGSVNSLTEAEAFGIDVNDGYNSNNIKLTPDWWSMAMRETSTGSPVVAIPRTSNHGAWGRQIDMYGHLTRPISLRNLSGPYYAADFAVEEER